MNYLILLNAVTIFIFLALLGIGFFVGYKRGAGRSIVRFVYIILIAIISFILALVISKPLANTVLDNLSQYYNESIRQYAEYSDNFNTLVRGILVSVIAPLLFPVIFLIIQPLSMIMFGKAADGLVSLVKKDGDKKDKKSRLIGGAIGALQGILIAAVLCVPLSVAALILRPVYSVDDESYAAIMNNNTSDINIDFSLPKAGLARTKHGLYLAKSNSSGINPFVMTGILTKIECGDSSDSHNLIVDGQVISSLICDLLESKKLSKLSETEFITLVTELIPYIEESKLIAEFTADFLSTSADIWRDGKNFLGFNPYDYLSNSQKANAAKALIDSIIDTMRKANPTNVTEILKTIFVPGISGNSLAETLLILSKENDFSSDDLLNRLADSLIATKQNSDTAVNTQSIVEVGKQLIKEAGIKTIPSENEEEYEKIKTVLEDSIGNIDKDADYSETVEQLAEEIISVSEEYNQNVTTGQARLLSISLLEYFGDVENITVEGLKEYLGVMTSDTDVDVAP